MDTVASLRGLTHDYGEVVALADLDLDIPGGVVGLVGANGAGKTTLLRIMLGLLHPTAGSVSVLGSDVATEPTVVRARVGYMPEGECLPKDQTAADFVAYAAELAGVPPKDARRRSSETLFLVGLEEERFRFIGDFSTGMQQRVKLAQAIVHGPDLVLLDEPASGLDPAGRTQMLELISRLAEFGIDVIFSSHVLTDIEATCTSVVMLDAGKLIRSGPIDGAEVTGTIHVELLGDTTAAVERIRAGGLEVSVNGQMLAVVATEDRAFDVIVEAAADSGAGILRMGRTELTLEDVFLHSAREASDG